MCIGGPFSDINGITADRHGSLWITDTTFDSNGTSDGQPGGVQQTLIATDAGGSWQWVDATVRVPRTASWAKSSTRVRR